MKLITAIIKPFKLGDVREAVVGAVGGLLIVISIIIVYKLRIDDPSCASMKNTNTRGWIFTSAAWRPTRNSRPSSRRLLYKLNIDHLQFLVPPAPDTPHPLPSGPAAAPTRVWPGTRRSAQRASGPAFFLRIVPNIRCDPGHSNARIGMF